MWISRTGILASSGGSMDADALAFITAAAITDTTQKSAINTLVTQLKNYGIWTKMKAIYPFVGGTAAQHRFNLKDPRTVTGAYYMQFNGGWTHNANGATPNGTNGYAETFFAGTNLTINSASYSIYNRTNTAQNAVMVDFGYFKNNSSFLSNLFSVNYAPFGYGSRVNSNTPTSTTRTNYQGFYNGNRNNSANFNFHVNGTKTITQADSTVGKSQINYQFHLGCLFIDGAYYGDFSTNNYAFAHIGDGLLDTEATNLYTSVQTFQTILGRQV